MALLSAAAPLIDRRNAAASQHGEAVPAEAPPAQATALIQESVAKQEAVVKQGADSAEVLFVSQIASQPLPGQSPAPQTQNLQATLAASQDAAASSDSAQAVALTDSSKDAAVPNVLDVVCADVKGTLTLDFTKMRCHILYKGQEMSGTEFEKAAGREKAKKWKTSVRVAPVNGKQGEMMGDWLQRHGLDVRMSQLFKVGEGRPAAVRPSAAPRPSAPPRTGVPSRPSGPHAPPPNSTATLASASDSTILEHLDRQFIGLQQGDPDLTFDKLPAGQPMQQMEPGVTLLDLGTVSYQQLMDLSVASAADPFGELLAFNPGVLPSRLGYMTGQQPKRQKLVSAPDPARAHQDMGQYLSGANPSAPWEAMGMSRPPVIGGRELDLRKFHEAVQDCGGFDAAVSNKKFGRIAVRLGINLAIATNAAYLLKGYHQRLLAPYLREVQPQADTERVSHRAAPQSEAGQDDMQIDSEQAEHANTESADLDNHSDKAGLDDSTIQQHSAILSARLQPPPDLTDTSDSEDSVDPAEHISPVPSDFKATLVDSNGPIPGLEEL